MEVTDENLEVLFGILSKMQGNSMEEIKEGLCN